MEVTMSSAKVTLKEIDLSARVASFEGVYGGIVIPAKKGPTDKPSFVSSDTRFLKVFTPNEKVEVGFDLSYFSALAYLERANRLWVQRAVNGATHAGLVLVSTGATGPNAALTAPLADPSAYAFDTDEIALIHSADQGAWGNDIAIKIESYTLVDDSFIIKVFKKGNEATPVETHIVSRVEGKKDGYGRNIFIDDVLASSSYIRSISNPLVASTTLAKTQSTALYLAQGTDGSAVTDTHMVAAVSKLSNPSAVPLTIIMDGGWATPAYQIAINAICQSRQDCVGILSVPYAKEVSANYLNDIVDYRKTELNMNSSYCAIYTPHLQIQDKFNDRKLWIAPDGHVAGSISFTAANYEIWYPAAGFKRGVINVLDTACKFEDGEMDVLYDAQINPVKFTSGRGIVIWGQKTLLSQPSALDRLNVRMLLIVIEPAIKGFLEDYLFELNDESVRLIIEGKLESYLETIKARKGITAYDVVCDDTNNSPEDIDANRLNVDIFVKPTRSIEAIPVRVVITPTGISFDTAASAI
jgi:hypothetical protein